MALHIRTFAAGEELALRDVFHSAVHELARGHYTDEQLAAWSPELFDQEEWVRRIHAIHPFVAEEDGQIVGYGDLQPSGYIDQLYVRASHARRGVGSELLEYICNVARRRGISELTADVSLCAEAFFARHGFLVVERRMVVVRAVKMANARMSRKLSADHPRSAVSRSPDSAY